MGQVTIYLDEDTAKKMKAAASAAGMSYSKWVAMIIRDKTMTEWPPHIAELSGAWRNDGDDDDDRDARVSGDDIPREPF